MASYGGLEGILTGLTKSTDHPSMGLVRTHRLFGGDPNHALPNLPVGSYHTPLVVKMLCA